MEKYVVLGIIFFFSGGFIGFIIGIQVGLKMGLRIKTEPPSPVPGILSIIGSLLMIVASIGSSIYSLYFITNSVQTEATVTEIREKKTMKDISVGIQSTVISIHQAINSMIQPL